MNINNLSPPSFPPLTLFQKSPVPLVSWVCNRLNDLQLAQLSFITLTDCQLLDQGGDWNDWRYAKLQARRGGGISHMCNPVKVPMSLQRNGNSETIV